MEADDRVDAVDRKAEIVRAGVRVTAAGGGAYLAKLFGPGAGASAAQALAEIGEVIVGALAKWEQRRILRTVDRFKDRVDKRLDAGEQARPAIIDAESDRAAEVFEAVVEAATRSIEEKKCDVIANLYAEVAFDPAVSVDDALLYLRRIRVASWRQLVALRYFEDEARTSERESIAAAGDEGEVRIHPALELELSELGRSLELIGFGQKDGSVANPANVFDGGTITSSSAARLQPTGLGGTISRLGGLSELVDAEELDAIKRDLRSDSREGKR